MILDYVFDNCDGFTNAVTVDETFLVLRQLNHIIDSLGQSGREASVHDTADCDWAMILGPRGPLFGDETRLGPPPGVRNLFTP